MANFATHIAVGTVAAGGLATLTVATNLVEPRDLVAVTLAGVLGSILPDIDLKESRASRAMFAGLGIFFSFAALFTFAGRYSIAELWILWLGTLVAIRYGVHAFFHYHAVHRGVWHSVLAGLFMAVLTAIAFKYVLTKPSGIAWLAGGFMFVGYIVHLTLDEVFSVDLLDRRLKASFGTALKWYDKRYPRASMVMVAALVAACVFAPSPKEFWTHVSSRDVWSNLHEQLLPTDGRWFAPDGPAETALSSNQQTSSARQTSNE